MKASNPSDNTIALTPVDLPFMRHLTRHATTFDALQNVQTNSEFDVLRTQSDHRRAQRNRTTCPARPACISAALISMNDNIICGPTVDTLVVFNRPLLNATHGLGDAPPKQLLCAQALCVLFLLRASGQTDVDCSRFETG